MDGYGCSLKYTKEEALGLWDYPKSFQDITNVFYDYCTGKLKAIPWSDQSLSKETEVIAEKLAVLNLRGFLTINSQPVVNGCQSNHAVFGWGPANGYVYQKAYLEFFIPVHVLDPLLKRLQHFPTVTYYAVNKSGDLKTNSLKGAANAVTWGVFPGKEIIQPTIVDEGLLSFILESFMAWKTEAFEIWSEWERIYETGSASQILLKEFAESCYLVNIVENDYMRGNIFKIFEGMKGAVGPEFPVMSEE